MAFIKNKTPKIGDWVITTREFSNCAGTMEIDTRVKIIDIGERGYDIVDEEGNRVLEIGWII